MTKKYLAYLALLAGWLVFCYWLYAKEIYPLLHPPSGTAWPIFDPTVKLPLAFSWGSEIPIAGEGFDQWLRNIQVADSIGDISVFTSYFFRDERNSLKAGKSLAKKRIDRIIRYAEISGQTHMVEILPANLSSDVRSKPFAAIHHEAIPQGDLFLSSPDTLEICFPLKDSLSLPPRLLQNMERWLQGNTLDQGERMVFVGTADGTGISESADMAWERANWVKGLVQRRGIPDDKMIISTGQRNLSKAVRNRCVIMYYENENQ